MLRGFGLCRSWLNVANWAQSDDKVFEPHLECSIAKLKQWLCFRYDASIYAHLRSFFSRANSRKHNDLQINWTYLETLALLLHQWHLQPL